MDKIRRQKLIKDFFSKAKSSSNHEVQEDDNIVNTPTIIQFDHLKERVLRLECSDESSSLITASGKLFLWGRDILN